MRWLWWWWESLALAGARWHWRACSTAVRVRRCCEQWSHNLQQTQTSLSELTIILFGTCTTDLSFDDCTSNLAAFSSQLSTACSKELSDTNELVLSTQTSLLAYPVIRNAGCLEDQVSGAYCYVDAVHAASPSDLYLYQLPLGTPMPNGTTPSCSACAGSILGVYAGALEAHSTNGSTKALEEDV